VEGDTWPALRVSWDHMLSTRRIGSELYASMPFTEQPTYFCWYLEFRWWITWQGWNEVSLSIFGHRHDLPLSCEVVVVVGYHGGGGVELPKERRECKMVEKERTELNRRALQKKGVDALCHVPAAQAPFTSTCGGRVSRTHVLHRWNKLSVEDRETLCG
jgi:hypothetical protein